MAFVNWYNSVVKVNYRMVDEKDVIPGVPIEARFSHVSSAISMSGTGELTVVPDAPADKRFWYALEDLDLSQFKQDHRINTYIARVTALLKKHS